MGQDASLQRYGDGPFMRFGLSLGQSLVDMLGVELRALNTLASPTYYDKISSLHSLWGFLLLILLFSSIHPHGPAVQTFSL